MRRTDADNPPPSRGRGQEGRVDRGGAVPALQGRLHHGQFNPEGLQAITVEVPLQRADQHGVRLDSGEGLKVRHQSPHKRDLVFSDAGPESGAQPDPAETHLVGNFGQRSSKYCPVIVSSVPFFQQSEIAVIHRGRHHSAQQRFRLLIYRPNYD